MTQEQLAALRARLAADPRFVEAKKSGTAYVIVGAREPQETKGLTPASPASLRAGQS